MFYSGSKISNNVLYGSPNAFDYAVLSISSIINTQFSYYVYLSASTILPGFEPIYVFLCPFNTLTSFSPPKEILKTFLFKTFPIENAKEVLPTPGGPFKHNILPLTLFFNLPTAKNSKILFLTSTKPSWSSSSIYFALSKSKFSSAN